MRLRTRRTTILALLAWSALTAGYLTIVARAGWEPSSDRAFARG